MGGLGSVQVSCFHSKGPLLILPSAAHSEQPQQLWGKRFPHIAGVYIQFSSKFLPMPTSTQEAFLLLPDLRTHLYHIHMYFIIFPNVVLCVTGL